MKRVRFTLLLLAVWLAGCASENRDFDQIRSVVAPQTEAPDPRIEPLVRAGAPQMKVAFAETGLAGVMLLEATRDGRRTWLSVDGATLIDERGMIVGERGFGGGLMSADVSQSLNAVYGGHEGAVVRFHSYLTGDNTLVTRSYKCTVSRRADETVNVSEDQVPTRVMAETCQSLDQRFENRYWISKGSARMVQSRQWLGDYTGFVAMRIGAS